MSRRMFHLVSPSGTPVTLADLTAIASARLGSEQRTESFSSKLRHLSGSKHLWLLNSGRSALLILLRGLKQASGGGKTEVVIPSWTCYSVAASIARAGLKIRLVDLDLATLDYDYDKLRAIDFSPVLAIVASNLFGIVSDWNSLESIRREHSVFLIDDAAQALGSRTNGRAAGTCGDAGLYSFDRGKNLSTWSGGALLTDRDDLAQSIGEAIQNLSFPGAISETATFARMCLYSALLRPSWYWFPNMLPFLGLGETVYSEQFELTKLSRLQQCAGSVLIDRLEQLNGERASCATQIATHLSRSGKFAIPASRSKGDTVYLRLPLLAADQTVRERAMRLLRDVGIMASTMYPAIIRDIPGVEKHLAASDDDYAIGRQIVARLFTVPTHAYVRQPDIDRIIEILDQV
jgi:perosamine synthetase